MGNLRIKKVLNGGVFIPWVLNVGHITEVVGPSYIIPVRNSKTEKKLLKLIEECGLLLESEEIDDISIIG